MVIADVTYGKGVFWKKIDTSQFTLHKLDLLPRSDDVEMGDLRHLPFASNHLNAVVLDPPYMHNPGAPLVSANYRNSETARQMYHADIIAEFYRKGMSEALRVLKSGGLLFVKCADEIESGCQCRGHIEVWEIAVRELDMIDKDLFVLVNSGGALPKNQVHAKKNLSFLWVFIKAGAGYKRPVRRRFLS